jgi:hypothetical protein
MSTTTDFDRRARAWLEDGPTQLSDRTLDAALAEIHLTRQRRARRAPWRFASMPTYLRLAAVAMVVAVVGVGTVTYFGSNPGVGGPTEPASPSPAPTPTATAPSGSSPVLSRILDTSDWATYTSAQYGYSLSYPADWTVVPATRNWTFDADAALDPRSTAMDTFRSPAGASTLGNVAVSFWLIRDETIGGGPGETIGPMADITRWAAELCRLTGNVDCEGVPARALPMCVEYRDCHPATLVQYQDDVQLYAEIGEDSSTMLVGVVWRMDQHPSTAEFATSTRLLEGFASTLNGGGNAGIWPAGYVPLRTSP